MLAMYVLPHYIVWCMFRVIGFFALPILLMASIYADFPHLIITVLINFAWIIQGTIQYVDFLNYLALVLVSILGLLYLTFFSFIRYSLLLSIVHCWCALVSSFNKMYMHYFIYDELWYCQRIAAHPTFVCA